MLTQCPECRQSMSTSASMCPHCGYVDRSCARRRLTIWLGGIGLAIVILCVILNVQDAIRQLDT